MTADIADVRQLPGRLLVPARLKCASEAAFTLVEILIVLALIAIVTGITIPTLFGSKETGNELLVTEVARKYHQAVRESTLDNNGVPPTVGDATGRWPAADLFKGPVNVAAASAPGAPPRRYIRTIPEESSSPDTNARQVWVENGAAPAATGENTKGYVIYRHSTTWWRLDVFYKARGGVFTLRCAFVNDVVALTAVAPVAEACR